MKGKKGKIIEVETQLDDEPDNIPDINDEDDEDDDEEVIEEEEEPKDEKCERAVHITTPYVSVAVISHSKKDSLSNVLKKAEYVMDKYKNHHITGSKSEDFR